MPLLVKEGTLTKEIVKILVKQGDSAIEVDEGYVKHNGEYEQVYGVNTWERISSPDDILPFRHGGFFFHKGKIYITNVMYEFTYVNDGLPYTDENNPEGGNVDNKMWEYDPATNAWRTYLHNTTGTFPNSGIVRNNPLYLSGTTANARGVLEYLRVLGSNPGPPRTLLFQVTDYSNDPNTAILGKVVRVTSAWTESYRGAWRCVYDNRSVLIGGVAPRNVSQVTLIGGSIIDTAEAQQPSIPDGLNMMYQVAFMYGRKLVLLGGEPIEEKSQYAGWIEVDMDTQEVTRGPLPYGISRCGYLQISPTEAYIVGGVNIFTDPNDPNKTIMKERKMLWRFNPTTKELVDIPDSNTTKYRFPVLTATDTHLYIGGGARGQSMSKKFHRRLLSELRAFT